MSSGKPKGPVNSEIIRTTETLETLNPLEQQILNEKIVKSLILERTRQSKSNCKAGVTLGGTAVGTGTGALIESFILPGVGTFLGALCGALIGGTVGTGGGTAAGYALSQTQC